MTDKPPIANALVDRLAEMALLGSILREPDVLDKVSGIVDADDFSVDAHQRIFRTILSLRDNNEPIEGLTLTQRLADFLKRTNQLDDVGRYAGLADLVDAVATGANAEYYAGIVRETATRRNLARQCDVIARKAAQAGGDVAELLNEAQQVIFACQAGRNA